MTNNNAGKNIAGTDEAGRGPLAGPVLAAAVILDPAQPIQGLKDSKLLSAKQRELLAEEIKMRSKAWCLGRAEVEEIDQINILQASLLAMKRAIEGLIITPDLVLVDGKHCPKISYPTQAIIQGDRLIEAISAASILAKVARDAEMLKLDEQYPQYGFAQHKGYPTAEHRDTLQKWGPCPLHRRSFAPVQLALKNFSK